MTKQEFIQHAWDDLWCKLHAEGQKEALMNNGWTAPHLWSGKTVSESLKNYNSYMNASSIEFDYQGMPVFLLRPKSLQGIETNNGWTKVKELGNPDKSGVYWCIDEDFQKEVKMFFNGSSFLFNGIIQDPTHWRVVVEFPNPLY